MANLTTMTRRDVLEGAAIGALGVCALSASSALAEEAASLEPTALEEADVVVVGSGIGGFSSAIRSAQNGAKVIMVEKLGYVGGATNFAEVCFGVGSRMQKEAGIDYTYLEVLHDECEFHNYRVNRILWEKLAKTSGQAIDWFSDLVEPRGGGFMAVLGENLLVAHAYKPTVIEKTGQISTKGAGQIAILETIAEELGITIYTDCPAKKLVTTDGAVTGVICDHDGEILQINAKAVILAASGFANDPEYVATFGSDMKQMAFSGCPGATGDAIHMAKEVGAAHKGSLCLQMMGGSLPLPSSMGDHINQVFRNEPYQLWVNQDGRRFVTEKLAVFTQAANAIDMQDATWSLMDDALVDFYQTYATLIGAGSYIMAGTVLDQTRAGLEEFLESKPEYVLKADSLEELAQKMGVPAENLIATVERYNELCAQGEDTDFGKPGEFLKPLTTPPFYAGRLFTLLLTTVGGIRINENAQVLNEDAKPIPGLYLVGSDADGFSGETYGVNLPGSTQSLGLTFGMIAADHACGA
ncbi:MAG: FAD-binding protein [Coriobacteriales bacterium]|nr:FAD-binding protein [Coriobacteriales bacterium]